MIDFRPQRTAHDRDGLFTRSFRAKASRIALFWVAVLYAVALLAMLSG